jgi:hypothetical protein
MRSVHVQYFLGFIFLSLGSWSMLSAGTVESLAFAPEHYIGTDASRLMIACFGAQAVLGGIVILSSRFTPLTFLVLGLAASLPFFGFNYYFYFVRGMFTDWMLLDFVGNVGILACGLLGYRLCRRESASVAGSGHGPATA